MVSSGKPSQAVGAASKIGHGKRKGLVNVRGRWKKLPQPMKPSQASRVKMMFVPKKDLHGVWNPSTQIECQNRINPQVFSEDSQNILRLAAWKNSVDIVWIPLEYWKKAADLKDRPEEFEAEQKKKASEKKVSKRKLTKLKVTN